MGLPGQAFGVKVVLEPGPNAGLSGRAAHDKSKPLNAVGWRPVNKFL